MAVGGFFVGLEWVSMAPRSLWMAESSPRGLLSGVFVPAAKKFFSSRVCADRKSTFLETVQLFMPVSVVCAKCVLDSLGIKVVGVGFLCCSC